MKILIKATTLFALLLTANVYANCEDAAAGWDFTCGKEGNTTSGCIFAADTYCVGGNSNRAMGTGCGCCKNGYKECRAASGVKYNCCK